MFNEKCRIVSRFKEYLLYDDDSEFLRTYHTKNGFLIILRALIDFYDKYNKIFPNYIILPENIFMYKNLRKKQKVIDEINKMKMIKDLKEKNINLDLEDKDVVKENFIFFDDKIKESISRQNNTKLTLSLTNTIISNYIYNKENIKNDCNLDNTHSIIDINNSSIKSIYNTLIKNNCGDNQYLYDQSQKSETSLQKIVDILNNKKFKKIKISHNKIINRKPKLNIDIFSSNHTNNRILTNPLKTQKFMLRTPINKIIKKEIDFKQNYHAQPNFLNNKTQLFNHKKNSSDCPSKGSTMKNLKANFLSKRKTTKFFNKYLKGDNNIIEEITSSLIGRYRSKQRNKNNKKKDEIKNFTQSKKKVHSKNIKNKYENLFTKNINNSKDNKLIKVNNYFNLKRINKDVRLGRCIHISKEKKRKFEEEESNNQENSKSQNTHEIYREKYKSFFNNKIKDKKKEVNRPTLETDSTESTKLSFHIRKTNLKKFFITCDKRNNNNQYFICNNRYNTNNEIIQTQTKEEYLYNSNYNTFKNYNLKNYRSNINNTENNSVKHNIYENCLNKNKPKQKKVIKENKKKFHKKHKTLSTQFLNNFNIFSFNKNMNIDNENEINNLQNKLKKIKEEIIKNKNHYIEINKKYRKLSCEDNKKKNEKCGPKKFAKMATCSLFKSTNLEKKENVCNSNNNKNINNELISKIKMQSFIKNKAQLFLHKRNYSNANNDCLKNPFGFGVKYKKELTNKNVQQKKDDIISTKVINKKIKHIKKLKLI